MPTDYIGSLALASKARYTRVKYCLIVKVKHYSLANQIIFAVD